MAHITFYGAAWCGDCLRSRRYLNEQGVNYSYIDIDSAPDAAEKVAELNNGMKSIPTILFPDGTILVEPSNKQLAEKLGL